MHPITPVVDQSMGRDMKVLEYHRQRRDFIVTQLEVARRLEQEHPQPLQSTPPQQDRSLVVERRQPQPRLRSLEWERDYERLMQQSLGLIPLSPPRPPPTNRI